MRFGNKFKDGYNNKINDNKGLFLHLEYFILYNVFWSNKPIIIFTYLKYFYYI